MLRARAEGRPSRSGGTGPRVAALPTIRSLCGCLLVVLTLGSCDASSATRPAPAVGVNSDITWGVPSADIGTEITLMKYAGVRWIRASVDLSGAEPWGPGRLSRDYLRHIDAAVRAARASGLNILMEFDRTPYWASADPARHNIGGRRFWRPYWTYRDPEDYARIVGDLVGRYAPMGVNSFELWNEPNNPRFWPSGPNPAAYVKLLRAADRRIRATDHGATVLMGGLMPAGVLGYLQGLYLAGARGFYDVANFHLYPADAPTRCSPVSFCLLDSLHSLMLANWDRTPVWITEFGWSTCERAGCVSEPRQRAYVAAAFRMLARPQYAYVRRAFIYQFRDLVFADSNATWQSGLGLVGRQFDPKPAYGALVAAASPGAPTAAAGRSLSLALTRLTRRARRPPERITELASGTVRGAVGGGVLILAERWVGTGWGSGRARIRPLGEGGGYRLRMRLRPGLWRIRALYGTDLSRSAVTELRP